MLKNETYRQGIINSSIFNVVGKSAAFVQQWLIGYYFGVGSSSDVFFFTYNIILFVSFFFLNFTTSVLIPEGMKIRNQESDEKSKQFFNSYIITYALIGIVLMIVVCCMPRFLMGVVSSFDDKVIESNIALVRWCIPVVFLNLVVSIISEILVSYKYFTMPNVITFVNYGIGIVFIVLFHDIIGLDAIAIGLVFGYIVNLVMVVCILKNKEKWKFVQPMCYRFGRIAGSAIYSQVGYVVYLVAMYVPQNMFSSLPAGYLTAINFADKILTIPSIFLVGQITNVMAVKINNMVASGEYAELSKLVAKLLIVTTSGLMVTAVVISVCSGIIVNLLFSWGNYNMDAMLVTERILSTMIFYLPFSFAFGIFMKIYNAFKRQDRFFYIQTFTQVVTIVLYFYFMVDYGIYVYPLCRIIPYIVGTFCALLVLKAIWREIRIRNIAISLVLISSITVCILLYDLYSGCCF